MDNNDDNVIDLSEGRIAKMRNLKPYRGKTDEEITEIIKQRETGVTLKRKPTSPKSVSSDSKFNEKFKSLQDEYGVDMNNSNDVDALKNLTRLQIQLDAITSDIDGIHAKETRNSVDYDSLKKLGDLQRVTMTSINDISRDLGISRKQRKEKMVDDIPQFIDQTLQKARVFFDKKTVKVECPKCIVELARYWLNFPREKNDIRMSLTCWKCKEVIEYVG